jgi:hypothetical protein
MESRLPLESGVRMALPKPDDRAKIREMISTTIKSQAVQFDASIRRLIPQFNRSNRRF